MFSKVLVANRGEIAVRILRALEELGLAGVAVYSEIDRDAPHVARAGEAYLLGAAAPAESYLNIERIIAVALRSGAQAIHPGYGFLAENPAFAARCEAEGIVFIGPPPSAIEAMGSKTRARELMAAAGVPIVPGTTTPVDTVAAARRIVDGEIGYPVAVKAAAGGGGKGLRVAARSDELEEAFEGAAREGERFFGDAAVYVERYLPDPRHVEVQILADGHGNVVHLGERDCSVQRRHQKLVEESPAPHVGEALRERIGAIATDAARAVDYRGAGTIEGLLADGEYFFLEMNTRVQVEHCVTEMTSGIDIVREGIRVAAGEPLSFTQADVHLHGHAIECRINAENAAKRFAPAPGTIASYREPAGPGVRVDSGVAAGSEISASYDPLVAKLIVWDSDRAAATARMRRALREFEITGLTTLLPFHERLLATEQWARAETCRDLLEDAGWLASIAAGATRAADGEAARRQRDARLHRRGRRPPLRRCASADRRQNGTSAPGRAPKGRAGPCGAPRAGGGAAGRQRRRARQPDAGHRAQDRRGGGCPGRAGDAGRDRRGDEDGERGDGAQGRHDRRAADRRRRLGRRRRRARRHRVAVSAAAAVWPASAPGTPPTSPRLLVAFRDWMGGAAADRGFDGRRWRALIDDPATEYLLGALAAEEPPCGVCQLRFRHSVWTATPDCWLEDLFVEATRRGAAASGGRSVTLAFERAQARGARRIELDTNEHNHAAIALYESLGFSSTSKAHGSLTGRDLFMGRAHRALSRATLAAVQPPLLGVAAPRQQHAGRAVSCVRSASR